MTAIGAGVLVDGVIALGALLIALTCRADIIDLQRHDRANRRRQAEREKGR